jgi:hypothetical protein
VVKRGRVARPVRVPLEMLEASLATGCRYTRPRHSACLLPGRVRYEAVETPHGKGGGGKPKGVPAGASGDAVVLAAPGLGPFLANRPRVRSLAFPREVEVQG